MLHAYRTLLRATDRRVTRVSGNPLWRDEVRAAFRAPVPPGGLDAALVRAEDLAFLVDRVNAHKDLLLSYGIRRGGAPAAQASEG